MKSVEASAKTRKEAIQKALDELGCELHEVQIEILDEGSRGFLGLGARDVRVRVSAEHLPDERPPRRREGGDRGEPRRRAEKDRSERERDGARERDRREPQRANGGRGGRPERPRGERGRPEPRRSEQRRPERGRPERERRGDRGDRPERGVRRDRPSQGQSGVRAERADRGPRPEPRHRAKPIVEERPAPAERAERKERRAPADPKAAAELGNKAATTLREIIGKMGIEAQVDSTLNADGDIVLNVTSEDTAILIGRKGRTLSALQFLINRIMLNTEEGEPVERIIVDVEGYLGRRKDALESMARSLAARAKETRRTMRVKPLSPQERRIVHLALEDDPEVKTYSLGNSLYRRIVIVPSGVAYDERAELERARREDGDLDDEGDVAEDLGDTPEAAEPESVSSDREEP